MLRPLVLALLPLVLVAPPASAAERPKLPLRVSDNQRFLVQADGAPFFWLGDTAWELFHRLDRDDAGLYLKTRAEQRFTVIQAVVLAEFAGLTEPNAYGHLPLKDNDPAQPVEDYFRHVDWIVNRAEELGLVIGMLPTWGDKWNRKWGQGPEIFTPENAAVYGEWLGRRYRDKPIVWILGGDRPVENDRHLAVLRALAAGLKKGDGGRHLMTFHPNGGHTSADWLHREEWLSCNMLQSGHDYNRDNYDRIARDYARTPVKPCLDGEPGYEDHPAGFKKENGYLGAYDVRKSAYWALFAGACGHTYGCHDIWQFLSEKRKPVTFARTPWKEAIHLPGAGQMGHVRALIESRPFLSRVPDRGLIVGDAGLGTDHVQATRAADGGYAFVYAASGRPVTVDLERLSGKELVASWYDPRTGAAKMLGVLPREGKKEFSPPASGADNDWVLVLDDRARGYPPPGQRR
jgi:hypothetical protein